MNLAISDGAKAIIERLHQSGFEAYIVGGAVRDLVMGKTPHDYDITTSAKPPEIKSVFKKTIDTGIAHGTVTVVENGVGYEVTTYRLDSGYSDSRHPDSIDFITDIKEDLMRRDFTINAMCYNDINGILDYHKGQEDIKARLIRTVGNPERRFKEDALRMLRAVRFAAVLGFEIEAETAAAIKKCAALILKVSSERVLGELNKILLSDNPIYIGTLRELGLMHYILPELDVCFDTPQRNKYHIYDVGNHILHATAETKRDLILRWAALLHDIGKPVCMSTDANGIIHFYGHHKESAALAANVLRRLRMDNDSQKDILALIENHDVRIEPTPPAVKRMLAKVGDSLFLKLLSLQISDNRAKNEKYLSDKLARIESARKVYENVLAEGQPYMLSDLVVNGRDLIKLGFKAGREIGDTLKILLGEVLISPELNTREYLLKRAKEIRRKGR
ncbi:MAG: CCA tRNA nucleotidyltransferase [Clostridia bacterium]|nr:CCA tRNA nucleotidyltransferase [Clostridia bacterium]MBQ8637520.1 CCA tRNA nucleotidyltransferase [Clostridia bacterium]